MVGCSELPGPAQTHLPYTSAHALRLYNARQLSDPLGPEAADAASSKQAQTLPFI